MEADSAEGSEATMVVVPGGQQEETRAGETVGGAMAVAGQARVSTAEAALEAMWAEGALEERARAAGSKARVATAVVGTEGPQVEGIWVEVLTAVLTAEVASAGGEQEAVMVAVEMAQARVGREEEVVVVAEEAMEERRAEKRVAARTGRAVGGG